MSTPHLIYGNIPIGRDGFTLERQPLAMLEHWYNKARNTKEAVRGKDDEAYNLCCSVQGEVYKAVVESAAVNSADVARQLSVIAAEMQEAKSISVIGIREFAAIAEALKEATAPLTPNKKTGALNRGKKLTGFGLIHRYQAFLVQELETIGWHVYGERDYPMRYRPFDDAVNKRCRTPDGRGNCPIFFAPKTLPARARSVLRSLKIDTTKAEDRQ
jgi:hypothetical protein